MAGHGRLLVSESIAAPPGPAVDGRGGHGVGGPSHGHHRCAVTRLKTSRHPIGGGAGAQYGGCAWCQSPMARNACQKARLAPCSSSEASMSGT